MTAAVGITTSGYGPPNAVVQIQPGMLVQPTVLVDQDGQYVTVSSPSGAEPLGAGNGEAVYNRLWVVGATTLTTQVIQFTYWTAATSGTATTVVTGTDATAASGLTYAAIGIYAVSSDGSVTRLASTGDLHTTLWADTYSIYTSSLTSNFNRVAGQRYALALLAVGATPPAISGTTTTAYQFINYPGIVAPCDVSLSTSGLGTYSTLPASVTAANLNPFGPTSAAEAIVYP